MSSRKRIIVPSSRPPAVREIQLINRVEEMDVLREAVDKAVGGQGGVVFLYGEAGIGKTRLARELGAYARSRGMQVLSGRCPALFRMDGVPPYVLWEEVIKDYLEVCTPEQLYRVIGSYPIARALGDIKSFVGGYDDSLKYWNDAFLLWTQLREKEKVSRLHRKMANVLWEEMGDAERSTERYDKALKILEAEPESVELASLYESMAHMNFRTGDMPKSLSLAKKALELAKKLNAHEVIASSYASLGTVYSSTGEKKKSIECLERALRIALDNGYVETALRAYNNLALVFWGEGEYERNLECLEKGFKLAKKVGHIGLISWIGSVLAMVYVNMGNTNKALLLAEESVTLARKAENMPTLSGSLYLLGHAYQVLGEWDKSEQYSREALRISKTLKEFQARAYSHLCLGWLYFDKGEYAKAREFYREMLRVLEQAGAKYARMWYCRWAIWAYIELGEIDKAENLIDSLNKFAVEIENRDLIASVDALKAMQYRAQKKREESIKHFEKSLQKHEAINARRWNVYWFARMVLCEYARVYLERDRKGDREKAHNLLNQALEIFQNMGAKKDIERVKSRLIYAETGRQMPEPKPTAEIPEVALPSHTTTGYGDLDDLLFGGIPRNYAVILTSPSCDERDLLIERYLEAGLKNGEVTFYVTIDPGAVKPLTEEFQSNFYLFVCNPQADKIIESLPNVFKLKGVENLTDINISLNSAFRKLDKSLKAPRRACIEIISDVLLQHHSAHTRRWLTGLIPELKSRGFTTLATMNPQMHPSEEVHAILGLFEGEINIYKKKTRKDSEKFLKIEKMLNQRYLESELPLKREKLQQRK